MDATISLVPEQLARRRSRRNNSDCTDLWSALDQVVDPEIPVLSIWDLGVLHDVVREGNQVVVTITPTYSGCPAMDEISREIKGLLSRDYGLQVTVRLSLTPAWTTDLISPEGKQKLRDYGIAPPLARGATDRLVACPQCNSQETECVSEFASTACKALYKCLSCGEPFDHFKCF